MPNSSPTHFTIITPSFNQLDYLKRCVASVRDQVEAISQQPLANSYKLNANYPISVHHHVQDGGSMDGTREYLAELLANSHQPIANSYSFSFASERDNGMYDAINKGIRHQAFGFRSVDSGRTSEAQSPTPNAQRLSRDSVIAWLNCDEQYLPGTLAKVSAFLATHPEVDILFGGMLMVNEAGVLLACRKAMPMRRLFLEASYLYNYSCAMFFRRAAWEKLGGLDTAYRNAGDEDLMRRAMKQRFNTAVLNDYLGAFSYGSHNLSSDAGSAVQEHDILKRAGSAAIHFFRLPINLMRLLEKALRGGFRHRGALVYEIYIQDAGSRTLFTVRNPSCRWPDEPMPYLFNHRLKGRSS